MTFEQSCRLLEIGTMWFERHTRAVETGDKPGTIIAKMAHTMCLAAHKGELVGVAAKHLDKEDS